MIIQYQSTEKTKTDKRKMKETDSKIKLNNIN